LKANTLKVEKNMSNKKERTAITPTRADDFPEWYQQVIKAADMAENAPVRGCMIIKPYGYALWENMQHIFDGMIKDHGVQNAYFPLLIPLEFMSREAEHVDGFAKECAVVTHHRLESDPENGGLRAAPSAKLEEPYIIRPTSETIIGDSMSRWIQSYRDLPLKLNQWCNVMRWEMRPRLFLRTAEFLWQEGHNAFETPEEADADALKMLDAYVDFVENSLAMPAVKGTKTDDEKFPGAVRTYTFEMMMQDGKALQGGTSHYLGDNFAKSLNIKYQGRDGSEHFCHTTSWGITTRLIGAMIMAHGDDDGMIMPPKVAPHQVGIIPIIRDDADADKILKYVHKLTDDLKAQGIRFTVDDSDGRTGDKMWGMIKKGIPVRVEIGAREVDEGTLTHVRRDLGKDSKKTSTIQEFVADIEGILDEIHDGLFNRAKKLRDENITDFDSLEALETFFKEGGFGFGRIDVSLAEGEEYERIKKENSLTSRCMPFADEGKTVIVGKAY